MLGEREAERARLRERPPADELEARAAQVLATLPARVRRYLDDLDTLLAVQQVGRGKQVLAALDADVVLRPENGHLMAEVSGDLGRVFVLAATRGDQGSNSWLGEEDSNPR